MKQTEYTVVRSDRLDSVPDVIINPDGSTTSIPVLGLVDKVNELIKQGWQCQGGFSTTMSHHASAANTYHQAMVRLIDNEIL